MAVFAAKADFSSSVDGKFLIIKDQSDYVDNDEGYTRDSFTERVIEIRYADNNTVAVVSFPYLIEGIDAVSFEIDKDKWLDVILKLTLDPDILPDTVFTYHKKIGYNQIIRYKQAQEVDKYGANCNKEFKEIIYQVEAFINQAKFYGRAGDGVGFNKYIDAANELLNNNSCGC